MPRLRKPMSAIDRLVFLKKAVESASATEQNSETYLSQTTIDRASQIIPKLEEGMGKLGNLHSISQKEVREKNLAMDTLQTHVKDFWEVLRRRVYRNGLPLDVFAYYQLPKSGNNPNLTTTGQWLETASLIIKGEADAIAAGYEPMVNPSIAQIEEKLVVAHKENRDVSEADKNLDKAQETVSGLMPEAKAIIDRIIAELEFNLYDKEDASKRRVMRNYGAHYEVTQNEPVEDSSDVQVTE